MFVSHAEGLFHRVFPVAKTSAKKFTISPSLVLIRLVLAEIHLFENVKIYKEMYGHPDAVGGCVGQRPDGHTLLSKF